MFSKHVNEDEVFKVLIGRGILNYLESTICTLAH